MNCRRNGTRVVLASIVMFLSITVSATAEDWKTIVDLRGKWKFHLGDDNDWANKSYADSKWDEVFVPSPWEDEGFPGYDGYAWYRKHFTLASGAEKKTLYLRLGCVDDVGEVYLNGTLIGVSGSFPPEYISAYNTEIILRLPAEKIDYTGDNVIAVRVYDDQLAGGIVQGKVSIAEPVDYPSPLVSLEGLWRFKKGDSDRWKENDYDDQAWKDIFVPAVWETQGYSHYDGFAWYRIHFKIPQELAGKSLVLMLGMIDDLDETYLNGELIGRTGRIENNPWRSDIDGKYQIRRTYTIPSELLKANGDNVIAVRVFDAGGFGGIYQGPVCIVTREQFKKWKRTHPWEEQMHDNAKSIFDLIFE